MNVEESIADGGNPGDALPVCLSGGLFCSTGRQAVQLHHPGAVLAQPDPGPGGRRAGDGGRCQEDREKGARYYRAGPERGHGFPTLLPFHHDVLDKTG